MAAKTPRFSGAVPLLALLAQGSWMAVPAFASCLEAGGARVERGSENSGDAKASTFSLALEGAVRPLADMGGGCGLPPFPGVAAVSVQTLLGGGDSIAPGFPAPGIFPGVFPRHVYGDGARGFGINLTITVDGDSDQDVEFTDGQNTLGFDGPGGAWSGDVTVSVSGSAANSFAMSFPSGITATGEWTGLENGAATITGEGTISASSGVTLGGENDTIGSRDNNPGDNGLTFTVDLDLGGGENWMRARAAAGITGGSGADTVEVSGSVSGNVDLMGGANTLTANLLAGGYTGGSGNDTVTIATNITGAVILGGDSADRPGQGAPVTIRTDNTLAVTGTIGGDVTSAATGTDMVSIGGGSGNIDLGGGANTLKITAGTWTGSYMGGAGIDAVEVAAGAVAGALTTGDEADTLMGGGTLSGLVSLQGGDDIIGLDPGGLDGDISTAGDNPSQADVDAANALALAGGVNLGGGSNKIWAGSVSAGNAASAITGGEDSDIVTIAGAIDGDVNLMGGQNTLSAASLSGDYTGGNGADTVILQRPAGERGDLALGTMNLGSGRNALFLVGSGGSASERKVILDLGGGPATGAESDTLHICGEAAGEVGCVDGQGAGHAFNVELSLAGQAENTWETIHVHNHESGQRSVLHAGTGLDLDTARLNNLTLMGNGSAGDTITLSGGIAIRTYSVSGQAESGTLFELDLNPSGSGQTGRADVLEFTGEAKNIAGEDGLANMASVRIAAGPGNSRGNSPVTIARIHGDSSIDGIRIWDAGLPEPAHVSRGGSIVLNGQAWTLGAGDAEDNVTSWTLTPGKSPSSLGYKDAIAASAGLLSHISGERLQIRAHEESKGVFWNAAFGPSWFLWTNIKAARREERLSERRKDEYENSSLLFDAGVGLFTRDTGQLRVAHVLSVRSASIESGDDVKTAVSGLGYSLQFSGSGGGYLNLSTMAGTSTSTKKANGEKASELDLKALSLSVETGSRFGIGRLGVTAMAGLASGGVGDVKLASGDAVGGYRKSTGDLGVRLKYTTSTGDFGQSDSSVFGAMKVASDFGSEVEITESGERPVVVDFAKRWFHASAGMSWGSPDSSLFIELASDQSIDGASASRRSLMLGYDSNW